jgi:hypothetical protein
LIVPKNIMTHLRAILQSGRNRNQFARQEFHVVKELLLVSRMSLGQ